MDSSGKGPASALDAFTFAPPPFNATRSNGQPNAIALFGNGLGNVATDSSVNISSSVQATIDGQPVMVTFAGSAPGFVGLNQMNIVFPAGITAGNHALVVTSNGVASNAVTISIR
jgi:uncharacterized protein (TIGR03437 family)